MRSVSQGDRPWLVINQSQSPQFQMMLEELAKAIGPCELLTGAPFPSKNPALSVRRGPAYDRNSLVRRAISWFRFMFSASWRVLVGRKPFLVMVTTNPPFLLHLAWLVQKLQGVPYVLIIWDIYPDHAIRQGWLSEHGMVSRAWRLLNRWSLEQASAVITLGEAMAVAIRAQAPDIRIDVTPNWADTDAIRPIPKKENPFALEHSQVERVTVLYSGNLGKTHGVSLLVDAAQRLGDLDDLSFLIIGDGLGLKPVRQSARSAGLKSLSILPLQPWSTVPLSFACADIAVVLQEANSAHLSVPSKTYSLMAAGCAIIASTVSGSDLARLVEDHGLGLVVPAGDADALAAAIRRFYDDPQMLCAAQAASRATAVRTASVDVAVAQYLRILEKVLVK